MKKVLALALSLAMGISLVACGNNSSSKSSADTEKKSASVSASTTESKTTSVAETGTELKAEIDYWSSWSETEAQALALREAADEFTKANPGVKINFTFNGRDNRNLVGSAVAAGTKITMMDANADNIKAMWSEMTMDLTPFFEKSYATTDGKNYIDRIMPSMSGLSSALFDGKYSYLDKF